MRRRFLTTALALTAAGLLLWPEPGASPDRRPPAAVGETCARSPAERDRSAAGAAPVPARADPAAPVPAAARPGRRIAFFDAEARPGDPAQIARDLLEEHRDRLGLAAMPGRLREKRAFASLSGWHLRLEQEVGGVPVYASEVSAHVAPDGRPLLVAADVFPLEGVPLVPSIGAGAARDAALAFLHDGDGNGGDGDGDGDGEEPAVAVETRAPRLVLLPEGRSGHLAWLVDTWSVDESQRVFVDALDGDPLALRNLRVGAEGTARVFDPNPVYVLRTGALFDDGDRDSIMFTNSRDLVTLERLDGTGFLRGTWCDTTASPVPAFASDLDWTSVTRGDQQFEQLMAYFHIDRLQQRLNDLGIVKAHAHAQRVNAHATNEDRSFYDPFFDLLSLGDGGVDDGEDADVILHEYGHALQLDQVEDLGEELEGAAMGEGFGDFLAALHHEGSAPSFDPLVASWDATSYSRASPPFLRRVDKNKRYPTHYVGLIHDDGEIWSRFLWDAAGLLGADDALRVVVESHFLLGPRAVFEDGANAVLLTNIALRDGRDDAGLRQSLDDRGLLYDVAVPPPPGEDPFEDNDSRADAAGIVPGSYEQLRLDTEDWYRVDVPALTRVLVSVRSDPFQADVDLTAENAAGLVEAASRSFGALESVALAAGFEGRVAYVRVHHGLGPQIPVGYDLTIVTTALDELPLKTTRLLTLEPGTRLVFRVPVVQEKVDRGRRLRVAARRKGRRGGLPDLRVVAPSGAPAHEFGDRLGKKKAVATVAAVEAGHWIVEITPRPGSSGRIRMRAKHLR